MKIQTKADLEKIREKGLKSLYPATTKISVGMATCGLSTGAGKVYEALQKELEKGKLKFRLSQTGCIGFCQKEPVVDILEPGKPRVFYQGVTPERSSELVHQWLENKVVEDLLLCKMEREDWIADGKTKDYSILNIPGGIDGTHHYHEIPFYSKQLKIALRNCGFINPDHVEEYIARGGYFSLYQALFEMKPEEIIRGDEALRAPWKGRGWFSYRQQVGILPESEGRPEIYPLQCRRRGSRGLHGSQCFGRRSSQRDRRDDHRCLCHRSS